MSEPSLGYRVEGDGPPLLLVHGFGISFNIWRELIPLLRPHFKLVMIELPGIGGSPLPAEGDDYLHAALDGIEALRAALGLDRWSVLGYSTGSRIAEAYTQQHAAHVSRLVLLCPLTIDPRKKRSLQFGMWLDEKLPAFGSWILSGWRLRFFISWLGFNLRPDPRTAQWYREISSRPVRALRETLHAVVETIGGGFSVTVPYLMIWGDRDLVPLTPRTPGAHDAFVHGRHAAPVESAEEVAAAIISFAGQEAGE